VIKRAENDYGPLNPRTVQRLDVQTTFSCQKQREMQSNMASSSQANSLTTHDAYTTLAGFVMLGVGTCCLVAQLLTPWTLLGSFFYGISGVSLLAYKSQAFREKIISHMSNLISKSICDK